jgi:predicted small lipoprotein YifL
MTRKVNLNLFNVIGILNVLQTRQPDSVMAYNPPDFVIVGAIMRANISLGIVAALVMVFFLQGCGRKGPLKLPAPKTQTPQAQTANPQTQAEQNSGAPTVQQNPSSR